ncbi:MULTISPECIES: hypothetical protein [Streptomyces]|uniref:Uncharacterized protein n=1 Tax=Streptomyces capillispiralis TaxID=68182 RepID=A0A561SG95_9ACTN|nr:MULTISPECIES: hypothetical protein [Streptomyces]TWF73892.1 hypothetical protein FHX78_1311 [Streptomyces capillispiralis]GHE24177.1 hypothetical protein GCM10017779_71560 [Streptomyces capillispiralis]
MTAIDELLADARIPTAPRDGFDVGAALRRLAADAAAVAAKPHPDTVRATQAGQRLSVVCRWILNKPDAADHVDRLAQEPDAVTVDQLDVDGALVFACLLHLTDHRESAQFWWQLAAGAGHRAAAYCLHLHHLALGESREARHWLHVVTDDVLDSEAPDGTFLDTLEAVAMYVRRTGTSLANAPTGGLEMEVDRLATAKDDSCIIVQRPDQRLADLLHDFTRR